MAWHRRLGVLSGAAVAAAVALFPTAAHAQDTGQPVSPTGKGITAGILLGAEVVMIPLGAAGVREWWAYAFFPPLAAAGGAVGGYFLEKSSAPPEASLYMLAGGIGLVIPALVLTLNATAYNPAEDEEEEDLPATEGTGPAPAATPTGPTDPGAPAPATPGAPGPTGGRKAHASQRLAQRTAREPSRGLFDVSPQRLAIGLPPLDIHPAFSAREIAEFGATQTTETHIALIGGTF